MAIGVSPVATRSAAGTRDSTKIGFCAAKSRISLSAFTLPMSLSSLAIHYFGRRGAPVIHFDAGFFLEGIESRFSGVGFQRSVDDGFPFFLAGRDQTCALTVKGPGA